MKFTRGSGCRADVTAHRQLLAINYFHTVITTENPSAFC